MGKIEQANQSISLVCCPVSSHDGQRDSFAFLVSCLIRMEI